MIVELGINEDEEMVCVKIDGEVKAHGNYWDVMPPYKIEEFFDILGIDYTTYELEPIG